MVEKEGSDGEEMGISVFGEGKVWGMIGWHYWWGETG